MTAMTSSADCPPTRLTATHDGLHRVAEHILAPRYLLAEETGGEMTGNFSRAFSHIGLVSAAWAIAQAQQRGN